MSKLIHHTTFCFYTHLHLVMGKYVLGTHSTKGLMIAHDHRLIVISGFSSRYKHFPYSY